jgi:hypothetical protein
MSIFAEYHRTTGWDWRIWCVREKSQLENWSEAIRRIDAHNPRINAVVPKMDDQARAAAKGDFDGLFIGVPFLLKDHLNIRRRADEQWKSGTAFPPPTTANWFAASRRRVWWWSARATHRSLVWRRNESYTLAPRENRGI